MEEKDIRNAKRMKRYYSTNENEKQRRRRMSAPKCSECQHRKALIGQKGALIYYCSASNRVVNEMLTSPPWCQKRMGLSLSKKEKEKIEFYKDLEERVKARKKAEKERLREIDAMRQKREARNNGMCQKCLKRAVIPGRSKCAKCLEQDMLAHRKLREG